MVAKKFANLHYPGIKANPKEGTSTLDPAIVQKFASQIQCIGASAQEKLLNTSILILSTEPLAVQLARKCFEFGIGHIGLLGEDPSLSEWAKVHAAWGQLETFNSISAERQLEDIARGFKVIIAIGSEKMVQVLPVVKELELPFIYGAVAGTSAKYAFTPILKKRLYEWCLKDLTKKTSNQGSYLPLLEGSVLRLATLIVHLARKSSKPKAFSETVDASVYPWKIKTTALR